MTGAAEPQGPAGSGAGVQALAALCRAGKPGLARALAAVEAALASPSTLALLDAAWEQPRGRCIGLTGPPGVGKSSLTAALVAAWRQAGRTVGIIAVDPSSRRSGGALLGDRTRLDLDPDDDGVFVRSMATRGRLGGLAEITAASAVLMRAVYDVVLVETVGVGQSETEIADLADLVVLAVQPGSGDQLQYMKAGIAEIPDIAVVTKADLGAVAVRTLRDLAAGLKLQAAGAEVPVLQVSSATGEGVAALVDAVDGAIARRAQDGGLARRRVAQAERWLERSIRDEFGRRGLERLAGEADPVLARSGLSPFRRLALASGRLA